MVASALVGGSVGLKPTNGAHAVALVVALAVAARACRWSVRSVLARCIGGLGLGWIVVAGPWAIRMMVRYGNPLFPFANGLFGSSWLRRPDGTDLDLSVTRFPVRQLDDLALVAFRVARG